MSEIAKAADSRGSAQEQVTVREAVLRLLRSFGMTTIFGNPGSTELPLFRDFPDDFRYVLGLQESVAVGMADGFAQATRNAAFVNLHSAAGVGHALGNLFTAYKNNTPLVVTAGQQARSMLPYDPFLFAEQATEFPKPYVKWSCQPARAEDVPAALARAYYLAMQAPQGPTFISIPVDDWDRLCGPIAPRKVGRSVRGDPQLIADMARALDAAERPAIVAGAAVARDEAWDQLIALAEAHRAPVWASPMSGRNSFPEDHPLFAGFLPAGREAIVKALAGSDVILVLGAPAFIYHTEGSGPFVPQGACLYQLTDDPNHAAWAPEGSAAVTSLKVGLEDVIDASRAPGRPEPWARAKPERVSGSPFNDAYVLQQIAALRPAGSIIVEEAPSSRASVHEHLPMTTRDSFYTCASGGLGHGLPAALGVSLGRPEEKVIALLGDGSAMYAIQGLWTAARLGLPISFIIVNNRRYEALVQFGRHFGLQRTIGTELPDIDFCALARGQGLEARTVSDSATLDQALQDSFRATGPTLLDVIVD